MITRTYCARMDHGGCGLLVHLKDGKIVKVEGDPESPLSRGTLCAKALAQREKINHPDRLKYPLKRKGARGKGEWERISWDEALQSISESFRDTITRYGPNAIAFVQGAPKGLEFYLMLRLANVMKVPTVVSPSSVCHMPRETASFLTCGFFPIPDYEGSPACIILWGSNLFQTNEEGVLGYQLRQALNRGAKLILIDPRRTPAASRCDIWLRPRPGTDLALALGMLNVIVSESLYERDFIENWTIGFSELRTHLDRYSPDFVSGITWIPREEIVRAARLFAAAKPGCIQWGNALEHNLNSFQCARALLILMAVTGNLEVPGGNVYRQAPDHMSIGSLIMAKNFPEKRDSVICRDYRMAATMGFTPSQMAIEAILTGKPYPIRCMYVQGGNPLLSFANVRKTFDALTKLSFLAVSDIFLTPTAQMADIVLPAATNFEFDDIGHLGLPQGFLLARPKIVEPPGECWPDMKILNELGNRLGYKSYFWSDIRECLDDILSPSGISFDDLKRIGILKGNWGYRTYLKGGFRTPSGRFEIYCDRLKQWGYAPLPVYQELPESPLRTPALCEKYPLIFTSAKDPYYFHSSGRNLPALRKLSPEPIVLIHPETAARYEVVEGEWIEIETDRGVIRQKTKFDALLDPRVLILSYGWWYPERKDLVLSGWRESNVNVLTDDSPPYDPLVGSANLRGVPCRIRRSDKV